MNIEWVGIPPTEAGYYWVDLPDKVELAYVYVEWDETQDVYFSILRADLVTYNDWGDTIEEITRRYSIKAWSGRIVPPEHVA